MPTWALRRSIFWRRRSFVDIRSLPLIKVPDGGDHFVLLCSRQFGKHGNGENFLGRPLRLWQRTFLVSEVGETRLQVQRQRIVNVVADLPGIEVFLQLVPTLRAQRVL